MTAGRYFDDDCLDARLTDGAVNAMARRQFAVSLIVGFALLAAAGFMALGVLHEKVAGVAARHNIVGAEAPRAEVAQVALQAMIPE